MGRTWVGHGLVYKSFSSGYVRSDFQNGSEVHRFFLFFMVDPPANSQIYEFAVAISKKFRTTIQTKEAAKLLKVWVCGCTLKSTKPQSYGKYGFAATPKPQSYKKYEFQDDLLPEVWAYNSYFSVLLPLIGAAKLLTVQKNMGSRSTFYHRNPKQNKKQ